MEMVFENIGAIVVGLAFVGAAVWYGKRKKSTTSGKAGGGRGTRRNQEEK